MKICSVCRRCYEDSVEVCTEQLHPALSEERLGVRDMVEGYRLDTLLESTVGSDVYRAVQLPSGQSCRISIFYSNDNEALLSEARQAASLFQPSVADTYEAGRLENGGAFVVAEDPSGRTLRQFLTDVGRPELLTSIEIIRQAAEALQAMHLNGLIHGAIRPENIVLSIDQESGLSVRIQNPDFGEAVARSITSNKFQIDSALDRLRYFAPEQCFGTGRTMQTDIYSLGIVFYELLAGVPPFDAAKATALIDKHRNEHVPDIRIDNFHLRMLVTHSLLEAVQKQPRLRQSSANLFARQLRHIEQLATHVSTPPPAGVVPKPTPARPVIVEAAPARPVVEAAPARPVVEAAPAKPVIPKPTPVAPVEEEPITAPVIVVEESVQPDIIAAEVEAPSEQVAPEPMAAPVPEEPAVLLATEVDTPSEELQAPLEPATVAATVPEEPMIQAVLSPNEVEPHSEQQPSQQQPAAPEPVPVPVEKVQPIYVAGRSRSKLWEKFLSDTKLAKISKKVDVAAPATRKKIEWQTPEDDIPSIDDVREAQAKEQLSVTAPGPVADKVEQAEVIPTVERLPEKVEPPAITLPPADIDMTKLEVAAEPVVVETGAQEETPVVSQDPVEIQPTPLSDLPQTQSDRTPSSPVEPVFKIPRPKKRVLRKVRRSNPVVGKPATPAVAAAGERMVPRMYGHTARPVSQPPKPAPARQRSGLGFKVNLADLEEITIVRPPSKRIQIDWEKAIARQDLSNNLPRRQPVQREVAFSPTILGASANTAAARPSFKDDLFAHFDTPESLNAIRQPVMIAGGFIVVLAVLLFAGAALTNYFQAPSSASSVTRDEPTSPQAMPATAPAAVMSTAPISAAPLADDKITEKPAPATVAAGTKRPTGKAVVAAGSTTAKSSPKIAAEKKKSVVEKIEQTPTQKPKTPAPQKGNTSTRPRIVATQD